MDLMRDEWKSTYWTFFEAIADLWNKTRYVMSEFLQLLSVTEIIALNRLVGTKQRNAADRK
jgi:hypothetical protein